MKKQHREAEPFLKCRCSMKFFTYINHAGSTLLIGQDGLNTLQLVLHLPYPVLLQPITPVHLFIYFFSFHCHSNVIEAAFSKPISHTKTILLQVILKPEQDARSQGGSWAAQEFRCVGDESSCLPLPASL